ncbi:MAG: SPOR domain-containing protein [Pseudomonadota bacterium]|nr:SPOR domain-containing protein [Pseudomonadota bacterium]
MTDRWKIVLLIILVLISLFFAFFAGLVIGKLQTPEKEAAAIERSVASAASKGGIEEGAANNSAQGDKAPRPKNVPFAPSTNQGSKTTGSASLPDIEREQKKDSTKKDTVSDKKSNPYIKTTLSALIANEQKEQKISAARLAERQKKAEPEKDAITNPKKTQALYTLSSSHSIDGKNVGLLLKKLTEIGLSPYIIDADGTNSKVIMRVGEYASRLDAERDLPKLPNLKGTSFIVLRVASIH